MAACWSLCFQHMPTRALNGGAVSLFNGEIVKILVYSVDLEDRHDAGVVQLRSSFGLGVEPLDVGRAGNPRGGYRQVSFLNGLKTTYISSRLPTAAT